jgi:hypothetical protein
MSTHLHPKSIYAIHDRERVLTFLIPKCPKMIIAAANEPEVLGFIGRSSASNAILPRRSRINRRPEMLAMREVTFCVR